MWQDYIISIVQWAFLIALIPTIRHKEHKPPVTSSVMTSFFLLVLASTFATLSLWNSAVSSFLVAVGWMTIAVQRHRLDRKN